MIDTTNPANPLREIREALLYFYTATPDTDEEEDEILRAALSSLAEIEAGGEAVATAWLQHGKMVNAFACKPRTPDQWAAHDRDGYWSGKGYSEAPLYTHPAASPSQGWMPIETAPKDKMLLGVVDGSVRFIRWGKTSHVPIYGWCLADQGVEDFDICDPTHWRPLPASPAKEPSQARATLPTAALGVGPSSETQTKGGA